MLGIDETGRGKPVSVFNTETNRWESTDAWDTGFVDLAGAEGLLRQVQARTPEFRAAIRWVAIHPAAVYAKAVTSRADDGQVLLPNATSSLVTSIS